MLERGIVTSIEKFLRKTFPGCYLLKIESPSTSGILDMYFAWEGRTIWMEIKRPHLRFKNWKNKKIQQWHQKQLVQNGVAAYFIFSLEDVKEVMKVHCADDYPNYRGVHVFVKIPGND